ncbi:MAG TPA: hypothetical protein VKC17_00420 [Sphingomicrobium sp.]|nr:hypothetical protein [Sphingomicrobium sp.]
MALEVKDSEVSCVVPWEGAIVLSRLFSLYRTCGTIEILSDSGEARRFEAGNAPRVNLAECVGQVWLVSFDEGGRAFFDCADAFLILIFPKEKAELLRAAVDVREAYESALDERQIWARMKALPDALAQLDKLIARALRE